MKSETPLAPGIFRLTSNVDDAYRGLPIPHGLALHAYLVRAEKTVVIDPYHEGEYGADEVAEDLEVLGLTWKNVDAVVFTSADPGLTWPVPVWSAKPTDLGGASLRFFEGMILETNTGVLFSGENWAGFGAVEETVLSTDANGNEARFYDDEALRWFVTHPQTTHCPDGVQFIAPAHGLLWPNPQVVVERTLAWQSWTGEAEDEITVVWSADPSQDALVFDLVAALGESGLDLSIFRVPDDHESFIRAAVRRSSGVVLGPGVDAGLVAGLSKKVWRPQSAEGMREAAMNFARQVAS